MLIQLPLVIIYCADSHNLVSLKSICLVLAIIYSSIREYLSSANQSLVSLRSICLVLKS